MAAPLPIQAHDGKNAACAIIAAVSESSMADKPYEQLGYYKELLKMMAAMSDDNAAFMRRMVPHVR